jgi:hypothetical protein
LPVSGSIARHPPTGHKVNLTEKTQNSPGSARQFAPDTHRARALAVVLAVLFALPAAADDANAPTAPSMPAVTPGGTTQQEPTERFAFTGIYRFSTRRMPLAALPLPRLTTGSLPPAPVKPNEPPTGTLGGPSPANAATSIPTKSQPPLASSLNPRALDHSYGNDRTTAAGRLQRISRANIAAASSARLSDPLPEPAPSNRPTPIAAKNLPAEPLPAATSRPTRKKPTRGSHHRRLAKYKAANGRPEKLPKWWYNAWHGDE